LLFTRGERSVMLDISTIINLMENELSCYYLVLLTLRNGSITLPRILLPLLKKYEGAPNEPVLRFATPQLAASPFTSLRALQTADFVYPHWITPGSSH
jgi:hypothetical protein